MTYQTIIELENQVIELADKLGNLRRQGYEAWNDSHRNQVGTLRINYLNLINELQYLENAVVKAYGFFDPTPTPSKDIDPYGKEAIKQILMSRDKMSEEEAQETISGFEEELKEMADNDAGMYEIEDAFADTFGLEPDYLFCFLNDVLAKESK